MLPFDLDENMSVEVNKMEDTFNTLAGNPFSFLNEVNCNIEEDIESDEGNCDGAYLSFSLVIGKRKYFTRCKMYIL